MYVHIYIHIYIYNYIYISSYIYIIIYRFGKPRERIKGKRGEGGVGFLVSEPLLDDVTIMEGVGCNETFWLRVGIVEGSDLYIGCVYLPTQGNIKHTCICADSFDLLEGNICMFQSGGEFCFWEILMLGLVEVTM